MRKSALLILMPIFLLSCTAGKDAAEICISSYNMYLFYDGYENGYEFEPFTAGNGYTEEIYRARVKKTAAYLMKHMGSSSVIVLQEIENSTVLHDILEAGLRRCGFRYYGSFSDDGHLGIGYVSKYPPLSSNVHRSGQSRPVLELLFSVRGEEFSVFTLHAPSRLNENGEEMRYELFSLLSDLLAADSSRLRIAIGDFNADIRRGEHGIASDESALSLSAALVATKDTRFGEGLYHSPMLVPGEAGADGTYFYQGEWSFLDSILLSGQAFDGSGWEYGSVSVISPYESRDINGYPLRFNVRNGAGYSDHFAISMILRYK